MSRKPIQEVLEHANNRSVFVYKKHLRETSRSVASTGIPSTYMVFVAFFGTQKVFCPNMACIA